MLRERAFGSLRAIALTLVTCCTTLAQTQATRPLNPSQQDAAQPPGAEQPPPRQPSPGTSRPSTKDPAAPPGAQREKPGTSPVVELTPPAPESTGAQTNASAPATVRRDDAAPSLRSVLQPVPVPALPSLTRPGINGEYNLPLSLNDAIRRALENNNDIEVARDDARLAEANLRALQGVYDPFFSFTPQVSNSITPQSDSLSGSNQSGTVSQTDLQFNPSYTRLFQRSGGQYQFFFNNLRRTSSSTFNQFNPIYSASLGVTFTQPLMRDRAIDRYRHDIYIQRKRLAQTDSDFRQRTTGIITQVQRAYWELVFALRDEQNRIYNLNLVREQLRRTELRIESGTTAPLERAEVQTELASRQADLLLAAQNVSAVENRLKQLILRGPTEREWTAQIVPTDEPSFDMTPINLDDALAEARANRPELRRMRLQGEMAEIDAVYYRNQSRPRVDLQSTLSLTGLAGSPVTSGAAVVTPQNQAVPENLVGGYGQMLRNLVGFGTRNVVVGVSIQLPVHNTTAKANLAVARIQGEQVAATLRSEEQLIEVEVRDSVQSVETARQRVLAARLARVNAELQLAGEQRLYQVGSSTTFLLFQRENQLSNVRNLELRAVTDYNLALADLQRSTSTTLRANNVVISMTGLD